MEYDVDKTIYQRPAELLQHLIRFNTTNPPGEERECVTYINHLLKSVGIKTHLLSRDAHRPNLVARLTGRKGMSPLLIYGHVDVVPADASGWTHPPFEGVMEDGCVWGRGAVDMKGPIAMMVSAFMRAQVENIQLPGDVVLCIVSDEENLGEYGSRFLVEHHPELFKGIRYALGEVGGFSLYVGGKRFYPIEIAQKQKCGIRAIVTGPSGHGSSHLCGGAMAKLGALLQRLDTCRLPVHVTQAAELMIHSMANELSFPNSWILRKLLNPRWTDFLMKALGKKLDVFVPMFHNTVNATVVKGGERINVIPHEIEVQMDVRLLPGQDPDDVIRELRPIVGPEVKLELMFYDRGPDTHDMGMYDTLAAIIKEADPEGIPVPLLLTGSTDARFFSRLGIQTYGFMPMQLPEDLPFNKLFHSEDERIPVDTLVFGAEALYKAMQVFNR